jgi:hypothetical protein
MVQWNSEAEDYHGVSNVDKFVTSHRKLKGLVTGMNVQVENR